MVISSTPDYTYNPEIVIVSSKALHLKIYNYLMPILYAAVKEKVYNIVIQCNQCTIFVIEFLIDDFTKI